MGFRASHLTGFNRLERAGELATQCYSSIASQLDYILSWFMGNPLEAVYLDH